MSVRYPAGRWVNHPVRRLRSSTMAIPFVHSALTSAVCPGSCPGGTGFCVQCYTIANPLKSNAEGQHIGLDASA